MNVLVYSEKKDYFRGLSLTVTDIHHRIVVKGITNCQLANEATSRSLELIVLDDTLYETLSQACIEMLVKSQVKVIVFLSERKNIKRYLCMNIVDYFTTPISWHGVDERLRIEYRHSLTLNQIGPNFKSALKLLVKTHAEILVLNFSEILYFERVHKNTRIYTQTKVHECHESLKYLLHKLPDSFVRVHNSYIINFNNAKEIINVGNRTYHVSFENQKSYALVSRKRSEDILDHAINHYRMVYVDEMKG